MDTRKLSPNPEHVSLVAETLADEEKGLAAPNQAIAYPGTVETRRLPGGTMLEMSPRERYEHLLSLAQDKNYMLERFRQEGALIAVVDDYFAVVEPTSPYGKYHVTIFRTPAEQNEYRQLESFPGLSHEEQARFIRLNLGIRDALAQAFPEQKFVIGVNRSARPYLTQAENKDTLHTGSQSVPILHSHIANIEDHSAGKASFAELYDAENPKAELNKKLMDLRTTHITTDLQKRLYSNLMGDERVSKTFKIAENTGRYFDIELSQDPETRLQELREILFVAEDMFRELEWGRAYDALPPEFAGKDIKFGYSWAITPDNNLRIGFTPYNTGSMELFDITLDRSGSTTPEAMVRARTQTRQVVSQYLREYK